MCDTSTGPIVISGNGKGVTRLHVVTWRWRIIVMLFNGAWCVYDKEWSFI